MDYRTFGNNAFVTSGSIKSVCAGIRFCKQCTLTQFPWGHYRVKNCKFDNTYLWSFVNLYNDCYVSAVVTEVYESKTWDHPMQLFYPAIPSGKIPEGSGGFATVDSTYLNVRISTSAEDQEKAKASLHCHQSQYTPQVMDQMRAMISSALGNTTYFKSHHNDKVSTSLF